MFFLICVLHENTCSGTHEKALAEVLLISTHSISVFCGDIRNPSGYTFYVQNVHLW